MLALLSALLLAKKWTDNKNLCRLKNIVLCCIISLIWGGVFFFLLGFKPLKDLLTIPLILSIINLLNRYKSKNEFTFKKLSGYYLLDLFVFSCVVGIAILPHYYFPDDWEIYILFFSLPISSAILLIYVAFYRYSNNHSYIKLALFRVNTQIFSGLDFIHKTNKKKHQVILNFKSVFNAAIILFF